MQLLEKHFDLAFSAPNGVQKLRELILTLAIQGKLVPQDPNDEPASKLLKEIEAEKKKLVKEGKTKQSKPLPYIKTTEVPYVLPKGWEWARFGEITINRDSERIPISKEDREKIIGEYDYYGASGIIDKVNDYLFDKALLLIGEDGANLINRSTPIAFIARGKYWVNNHAHVIDAIHFETLLYLEKYINAIDLKPYVTGSAQPKMNQAKMHSIVIALPPLAEQRRIVAKIDRLMAQCDELEKLKGDRNKKRITVHTAAINQLLTAQEDSDFSTAWDFIQKHFSKLYTVKENVAELRKAILQLAVMGKLVPQDPNDEPASELLKAIKMEKQKLVEEGKIKNSKPLPSIQLEDVLYKLPKGWELIHFDDLCTEISTGPFGLMIHKSDYIENGIPLVNPIHMINGKIIHDSKVTVTPEKAEQLNSYRLFEDDIVMARRGELGRCAIVEKRSHRWLCGTGSFVLRFIPDLSRAYLLIIFQSQRVRDYLGGNSVGTTMTNLNHGILRMLPILLPPLAEQHRIVTKVDQLMALCDRLEQQIDAATEKRTELLNTLMAQV
ncbi:MAG TPA: restriction endonuclease subunit S [Stenomitos sp.]